MSVIDMQGENFGRLTVLSRASNTKTGQARWSCRCSCGKECIVAGYSLRNGNSRSCGCLSLDLTRAANTRHGDYRGGKRTRLYTLWASMKLRCHNPTATQFKYYGGKGIKVCEEWHDYAAFKAWALSHGYAEGLEIDRINSDGNYSPDNCQFITGSENKRKMNREKSMR